MTPPQTALLTQDWRRHVPPHVVWSFLYGDGQLLELDREHILDCNECLEMFIVCLKSQSFGSVLLSLRHPPGETA